jgi:uncharacterized protein YhaN
MTIKSLRAANKRIKELEQIIAQLENDKYAFMAKAAQLDEMREKLFRYESFRNNLRLFVGLKG